MKVWKSSAGIVTVLLAVCAVIAPVSAHILEVDQGISVVLHVLPDDNPVAGQPATLQFTFTNTPATFSLPQCDCKVEAKDPSGKVQTVSTQWNNTGNNVLTSDLTFQKSGNYVLTLNGYTDSSQKKRFQLTYDDVQVGRAPVTAKERNRAVGIALIAVCAVAAIIVLWLYYRPQPKRRK